MKKVMIFANIIRSEAIEYTAQLIPKLCALGFEPILDSSLADMLTNLDQSTVTITQTQKQAIQACEFIVIIGGDGTILRILHSAAQYEKPLLGINKGRLGFISELEDFEHEMAAKLLCGEYEIQHKLMLDIQIIGSDGQVKLCTTALNEAAVLKGNVMKSISLELEVNGRHAMHFAGDGVLVCTPTGSTAYSLAAGGPILAPETSCFAITPVCPHAFNVKSFVISSNDTVRIIPETREINNCMSPDGLATYELAEGDSIVVKKSCYTAPMIRLKKTDFYKTVNEKLLNGGRKV